MQEACFAFMVPHPRVRARDPAQRCGMRPRWRMRSRENPPAPHARGCAAPFRTRTSPPFGKGGFSRARPGIPPPGAPRRRRGEQAQVSRVVTGGNAWSVNFPRRTSGGGAPVGVNGHRRGMNCRRARCGQLFSRASQDSAAAFHCDGESCARPARGGDPLRHWRHIRRVFARVCAPRKGGRRLPCDRPNLPLARIRKGAACRAKRIFGAAESGFLFARMHRINARAGARNRF